MDKNEKKTRKERANKIYKEDMMNRPCGVFCIRNMKNGKVFIDWSLNIPSKINRIKAQLRSNSMNTNKELQNDYNEHGEEFFEFEILEEVDKTQFDEDDINSQKKQVESLYKKWLNKIQPYGDNGYNKMNYNAVANKYKGNNANKEIIAESFKEEGSYYSIKDISTLFWNATIDQLKKGYVHKDGNYVCLVCGKYFNEDEIFPKGMSFYNAKRAVEEHIKDAHDSMFDVLLNMDKKYTGLSQIQTDLIEDFYKGLDDDSIAKKSGIAKSTVRNHRFRLKEKQKQAKVFLALMNIVEERQNESDAIIDIHKTPKMLDERYAITNEHQKKVLEKFIDNDGKLKKLPKKEMDKIIILFHFASQFVYNRKYDEAQVNSIIKSIYSDFVTIRRYLIEYGFMERTKDGSSYWVV